MAVEPVTLSRRALVGALAAAPLVTTPVMAAALTTAASPASSFYAEIDALDREAARLNAASASEAEWLRWEERAARLYSEVEALPPTLDNARIKARVVWSIVSGDLEEISEGQSACCRLVRQIISGLSAGVN